MFGQAGFLNIEALYHGGIYTGAAEPQEAFYMKTVQSSAQNRRSSNKDTPSHWTQAVRVRLPSDPGSETASIVCVVIMPASMVRPTPATHDCSVYTRISTVTSKTFAMLGSEECSGGVSFIASELYQRVDKLWSEGQIWDVAVPYLEVYNKVVCDLLCLDPAKTIAILNVTKRKVKGAGTVLQLLLKGNKSRTHHVTDATVESAWSHAIFQSYVALAEYVTSTSKEIRASMCSSELDSLEGAAAASGNIKDQMRQGTKLNLSLLSLGNCIDACSRNWTQQVPCQDSKLTHILKDSLGASCNTLMIGTATALNLSSTETYNTQ
ncbi:kinesin-like protein KIF18B [Dermacentor variabilis]|uniref:kinesin-like protein KIF18B n=1 Tax=Dermacentor variabilis TaxID=34621 RepID=UPI003F5B6769